MLASNTTGKTKENDKRLLKVVSLLVIVETIVIIILASQFVISDLVSQIPPKQITASKDVVEVFDDKSDSLIVVSVITEKYNVVTRSIADNSVISTFRLPERCASQPQPGNSLEVFDLTKTSQAIYAVVCSDQLVIFDAQKLLTSLDQGTIEELSNDKLIPKTLAVIETAQKNLIIYGQTTSGKFAQLDLSTSATKITISEELSAEVNFIGTTSDYVIYKLSDGVMKIISKESGAQKTYTAYKSLAVTRSNLAKNNQIYTLNEATNVINKLNLDTLDQSSYITAQTNNDLISEIRISRDGSSLLGKSTPGKYFQINFDDTNKNYLLKELFSGLTAESKNELYKIIDNRSFWLGPGSPENELNTVVISVYNEQTGQLEELTRIALNSEKLLGLDKLEDSN